MNLIVTGKYRQRIAASWSLSPSVYTDRVEYDLTLKLNSQNSNRLWHITVKIFILDVGGNM